MCTDLCDYPIKKLYCALINEWFLIWNDIYIPGSNKTKAAKMDDLRFQGKIWIMWRSNPF